MIMAGVQAVQNIKCGEGAKALRAMFLCLLMLAVPGCDIDNQLEQNPLKQQGRISFTAQMHHLHMLINHALQMAAQGADMQLLGKAEGEKLLNKSAELLDRAMTGMEMASLHRQGWAGSPLMFMTHELADMAKEMIALMRQLSTETPDKDSVRMFNHAIEVAAMGSSLIMLGQQGMAGNIDLVMVNHGQSMLGEASGLLHEISASDAYAQAAIKIVQMLIGIPENPASPENPPAESE